MLQVTSVIFALASHKETNLSDLYSHGDVIYHLEGICVAL